MGSLVSAADAHSAETLLNLSAATLESYFPSLVSETVAPGSVSLQQVLREDSAWVDIRVAPRSSRHVQCLVLGDSGCGKTALVEKLLSGSYNPTPVPTRRQLMFKGSLRLESSSCGLWDVCGSDEHLPALKTLLREQRMDSAMVMYDISSPRSVRVARSRLDWLRTYFPQIIIWAVVGCKSDLRSVLRPEELVAPPADSWSEFEPHLVVECSAMRGDNVQALVADLPYLL